MSWLYAPPDLTDSPAIPCDNSILGLKVKILPTNVIQTHTRLQSQCHLSLSIMSESQADVEPLLKGNCFCGSATLALTRAPVVSAYCHCTNCQRLHGAFLIPLVIFIISYVFSGCPCVHTVHFEASAFSWTRTEPAETYLDSYVLPDKPYKTRWRCKTCGSCVASKNSRTNRWSVWGCVLARDVDGKIKNWDIVKPTAHIFYGTRVLDVADGLGKWEGYENKSAKLS